MTSLSILPNIPVQSAWRDKIKAVIDGYDVLYFYSVDPGATAILKPVYEEAKTQKKAQGWFVEGWAAQANISETVDISKKPDFLHKQAQPNHAIVMGQQIDFKRGYQRLKLFKDLGYQTIFISDHWKDISGLFFPGEALPVLPNKLYVPDDTAYQIQIDAFLKLGFSNEDMESCFEIFIHPGIEHSLEKIQNISSKNLNSTKEKYGISDNCITMMLDPITDKEKDLLGFGWDTALDQALQYFQGHYDSKTRLLIKPHPKQDKAEIERHLQTAKNADHAIVVDEQDGDLFVALSDEIWGITTVLLVVALKAGKPIKVFMPSRTKAGRRQTNAHIEPFWIK